jgi:hypothetical protein
MFTKLAIKKATNCSHTADQSLCTSLFLMRVCQVRIGRCALGTYSVGWELHSF